MLVFFKYKRIRLFCANIRIFKDISKYLFNKLFRNELQHRYAGFGLHI